MHCPDDFPWHTGFLRICLMSGVFLNTKQIWVWYCFHSFWSDNFERSVFRLCLGETELSFIGKSLRGLLLHCSPIKLFCLFLTALGTGLDSTSQSHCETCASCLLLTPIRRLMEVRTGFQHVTRPENNKNADLSESDKFNRPITYRQENMHRSSWHPPSWLIVKMTLKTHLDSKPDFSGSRTTA